LIVALADPTPQPPVPRRTVLVLDVSATLGTREPGGTRLDQARRRALALVDDLPADAEVTVLTAGAEPALALPLTRDLALVRHELAGIEAQDVDGDLLAAVKAAAAFLDPKAPAGAARVVVLSDFAGVAPRALRDIWRHPAQLVLQSVGTDQPDAAIAGLWCDDQGAERLVRATVAQRKMDGRQVAAGLRVGGREVARQAVTLAAATQAVEFRARIPEGAEYEVTLDTGDALPADDRAFGVAASPQRVRVMLVTPGNPALERALRASPGADVRVTSPEAYTGPDGAAVVVIDGAAPPALAADGSAGVLFIGAVDPWGWGRAAAWTAAPAVTHWAGDHALLADLDPTGLGIPRALRVQWAPDVRATELLGAEALPLIVELQRPASPAAGSQLALQGPPARVLCWLFDLRDTDLPRRVTFPLLLWNAIDYLRGAAASGAANLPTHRTGRPLHLPAGPVPQVTNPAGQALPVQATHDGWAVFETGRQGIYRCQNGPISRPVAFSLLSDRGTRPLPAAEPAPAHVAGADGARGGWVPSWLGRHIRFSWPALLVAAGLVGLLEWLLYHRRVVRIG
jgi:Ca-activated chloride channel homolog